MTFLSKNYSEYYEQLQDVAERASKAGYHMIGFGAEPKRISDRQHQLVTKVGQHLVFTGTVADIDDYLAKL